MAIPYIKQTWVDNNVANPTSAARLTVIENGIFDAHYQPAVRVTHNTTQAIVTTTLTALAFNTERYDQSSNVADTMHDTATNNSRLTCRYAGVYKITGSAEWASSPTNAEIRIKLNGVDWIGFSSLAADYRVMNVTTDWSMAVNDYVELFVQHFAGTNRTINNTAKYSPEFMMVRVG